MKIVKLLFVRLIKRISPQGPFSTCSAAFTPITPFPFFLSTLRHQRSPFKASKVRFVCYPWCWSQVKMDKHKVRGVTMIFSVGWGLNLINKIFIRACFIWYLMEGRQREDGREREMDLNLLGWHRMSLNWPIRMPFRLVINLLMGVSLIEYLWMADDLHSFTQT